jgi:Fic family protein
MANFDSGNREYLRTHPWITFEFPLHRLSSVNWMRIGEALSKCDHIAGVPLAPEVAAELHQIYLAKGVHATTSIEGNTLSEDEVRQAIDGTLDLPESQEYLRIEATNIAEACDFVVENIAQGADLRLTPARIFHFHKMVLNNLPPEDGVMPGQVRTRSVTVGNVYRGAPAADCEFLLAKLCDWLDRLVEDAGPRYQRSNAILRAILAHLYIAWIHPFGNGNGRTARLVEFQLLAAAGLPTPACHLLSNYYNRTRTRYYEVLRETSRREPYNVEAFVTYALDGFVEELREQLNKIREHQMSVAWINHVHQVFRPRSGGSAQRQRELVLSLPPGEAVPPSAIRRLTPSLAVQYANKQQKTVTRDLNVLQDLGLIERMETGRVRTRIETMAAFLPLRRLEA